MRAPSAHRARSPSPPSSPRAPARAPACGSSTPRPLVRDAISSPAGRVPHQGARRRRRSSSIGTAERIGDLDQHHQRRVAGPRFEIARSSSVARSALTQARPAVRQRVVPQARQVARQVRRGLARLQIGAFGVRIAAGRRVGRRAVRRGRFHSSRRIVRPGAPRVARSAASTLCQFALDTRLVPPRPLRSTMRRIDNETVCHRTPNQALRLNGLLARRGHRQAPPGLGPGADARAPWPRGAQLAFARTRLTPLAWHASRVRPAGHARHRPAMASLACAGRRHRSSSSSRRTTAG